MLEYQVVIRTCAASFEAEINRRIGLGWQPQGGVSIATNSYGQETFAQAMTKQDA